MLHFANCRLSGLHACACQRAGSTQFSLCCYPSCQSFAFAVLTCTREASISRKHLVRAFCLSQGLSISPVFELEGLKLPAQHNATQVSDNACLCMSGSECSQSFRACRPYSYYSLTPVILCRLLWSCWRSWNAGSHRRTMQQQVCIMTWRKLSGKARDCSRAVLT